MAKRASRFSLQILISALLVGMVSARLTAAEACESLTRLELPKTHITLAQTILSGSFLPSNVRSSDAEAAAYKKIPEFCRVVAELNPTKDSRIEMEVWLPTNGWNEKFRGEGNGGFAGAVNYRGMASSVMRGYATAATDAGHKGEATDASWALGHPEKVTDFGYRAIHEMTVNARTVIDAFYRQAPKRAYFDACSDGGREALMEAQRFPQDYDGILAGAPANFWTHMLAGGLDVEQTTAKGPANYIPPSKLQTITAAALKSCDAQDGVRDEILNDPSKCHFNPESLVCRRNATPSCLSAPQVKSLEKIYAGGMDEKGRQIFPGLMPSSEAGDNAWKDWVTGESLGTAEGIKYMTGFFQNMVFEDPEWDFRTAHVGEALRAADQKLAATLNATDPDLSKFEARGGKLILYHGWLDPAIAPLNTINYYHSVIAKMGRVETERFVRLYMMPGMRHCAGGPGPFIFGQLGIATAYDPERNVFTALEDWVEKDRTPENIIATKLRDDKDPNKGVQMTRPLCPFPQVAKYSGHGSTNEANTFACEARRE